MDTEQLENTGRKRDELQPSEKWFADAMREQAESTSLRDSLSLRRQASLGMLDSGVPAKHKRRTYSPPVTKLVYALDGINTVFLGLYPMFIGAFMLLGLIFIGIGTSFWEGFPARMYLIVPLCLVAAVAFVYMLRCADSYRERIRGKIEGSGIVEKILLGPEQLEVIYRYVPWPWAIFIGLRPRDIQGWTKLVARNLEWYLEEPKPLFRVEWVAVVVYLVISITYAVAMNFALHAVRSGSTTALPSGIIPTLIIGSLPIFFGLYQSHYSQRMLTGVDELKAFIRERFADADEGTA
ncbi:hypothetical protein JW859_15115 [bacterium]|nr:hypothetical protein [bacterium]